MELRREMISLEKEWLGELPDWGIARPVDPSIVDPADYEWEDEEE